MNLNNFNLDNMEVLILPIICVVVFTILVLLPRRNRMHQQKAMQIIKYLTQERPQMLAQVFPYWQLSELQDYT